MKKLRLYFIGGALAKNDDVFEQVKAEVLYNFTAFFIITNIPYLFVQMQNFVHACMGISTLGALIMVLVIIKKTNSIKKASYFFLINFFIQDVGHYIINNGNMNEQGILYAVLFALCGYLLLDKMWGNIVAIFIVFLFIIGLINQLNNLILWKVPMEVMEDSAAPALKFLSLIPIFLIITLIKEFVKARKKAEGQLSERKKIIEEKQKEIMDSFRYARRIQRSLLPNEKYISKNLEKLKK
jgi:hypothetical protein